MSSRMSALIWRLQWHDRCVPELWEPGGISPASGTALQVHHDNKTSTKTYRKIGKLKVVKLIVLLWRCTFHARHRHGHPLRPNTTKHGMPITTDWLGWGGLINEKHFLTWNMDTSRKVNKNMPVTHMIHMSSSLISVNWNGNAQKRI